MLHTSLQRSFLCLFASDNRFGINTAPQHRIKPQKHLSWGLFMRLKLYYVNIFGAVQKRHRHNKACGVLTA
jgi:hypothetical protein